MSLFLYANQTLRVCIAKSEKRNGKEIDWNYINLKEVKKKKKLWEKSEENCLGMWRKEFNSFERRQEK
jgi:hypothetical protein